MGSRFGRGTSEGAIRGGGVCQQRVDILRAPPYIVCFPCARDRSLITWRGGGGLQKGRVGGGGGGGRSEVLAPQMGEGGGNRFSHTEGGHKRYWGSLNTEVVAILHEGDGDTECFYPLTKIGVGNVKSITLC